MGTLTDQLAYDFSAQADIEESVTLSVTTLNVFDEPPPAAPTYVESGAQT